MLQQLLAPQLEQDADMYETGLIFQQDGPPPQFHLDVRTFLSWSNSKAPKVTRFNSTRFFFLWGYIKDKVFLHPSPTTTEELRVRNVAAIADVDADMLTRVWDELG
jgi:hypothetical protein